MGSYPAGLWNFGGNGIRIEWLDGWEMEARRFAKAARAAPLGKDLSTKETFPTSLYRQGSRIGH